MEGGGGGGRPSAVQAVLLVASTAVTALLYSVYRQKARVARGLEGARRVRLDGDLRAVLLEAPGRCVPYAVIEGVVRSVKETLSSQFVENCKGVVQRLTLQEHKMVWNRTTHLWNDYEKVIHQRTNTAPFELGPPEDGAGGVAVRVLKPLEAAELSLETVYEKFHPSVQSFTDAIGHYISGERPKGIQETEQMLRVGTALTGVGELVLDASTIKLQPPKQAMPYYLSTSDFHSLLQKQEASARFWKTLTVLFGFATCAVLFLVLRKQYRHHRERRQLRQMQEEFRQAQERLLREVKAEGGETLKNACVVCLSNPKACVFLECGHVCSCHQCYQALPQPRKCPICRQGISRVVPLYNS
ncbi:mitochondrial ubiquitin ligase activator of NFKB 1 [Indicator indicator]|uniref:mitochondrial ubiquitin ligase activator of NFKB 1 n=1 Tax=Indicator indicator TaxID=1002788 RepID=UPI0023DEC338|nr:mitochondrial ubiquitin ligase activator of NFKB 1 [Indicator indicator]